MAEQHAIGGGEGERIAGRFLPGEVLGPLHELAILHAAELGEGAVRRLIAPDALRGGKHRVAAQLAADEEGALVSIIDQRVSRLTPRNFSYTLAKSALWTATRTMAQAYAPKICVNAEGPCPVFPNEELGTRAFEIAARVAGPSR